MKTKIIKASVLFAALVIIGLVAFYSFQAVSAQPQPMNAVSVNGYFIDVNGDGLLDYVVASNVIINKGGVNLPPSP